MIERLYKLDLEKLIRLKDWRSIRIWCMNNGVGILSDTGSKRPYVLKIEFEAQANKRPEKYLKEKYSIDSFSSALNSSLNFCSQCQFAIDNNSVHKPHDYKIEGEHEKKFKSILLNILNELRSDSDGKSAADSQI